MTPLSAEQKSVLAGHACLDKLIVLLLRHVRRCLQEPVMTFDEIWGACKSVG